MSKIKNNDLKTISKFSRFSSLEEFNKSFYNTMVKFGDEFTTSEVLALKALKNRSAKYFGVAFGKVGTIVSDTHKEGIGISRSSFSRMLRKAKKFGIVDIVTTQSVRTGGQGNNIFVFRPCDTLVDEQLTGCEDVENADLPVVEEPKSDGDTTLPYTSPKQKDLNIRTADLVSNEVPTAFTRLLSPFFDVEVIEEGFKNAKNMFRKEKRVFEYAACNETFEEILTESAKSLIKANRRLKQKGSELSSPIGYLTNSIRRMMGKERISTFEDVLSTVNFWTPLNI